MPVEISQLAWAASWGLSVATIPSVLTRRAGRPTAALSWLLALFMFPVAGAFAWWTVGRSHLRVKVRQRRTAEIHLEASLEATREKLGVPVASPTLQRLLQLPEALKPWVFHPSSGNSVELLSDGRSAYETWIASIATARSSIHLLFYIWKADRIGTRMRDALIDAAKRGVIVRMLLDGVGTGARGRFFRPLIAAGVEVRWFLPPWRTRSALAINFRNHRKLLIVDGEEGFVGGLNVADEYERWIDCAARIRGPSVEQLQEVFCDDWYFATGEDIVRRSPFGQWSSHATADDPGASVLSVAGGPHQELNAVREVMLSVLSSAEQRVWLITPYFIPDGALITILRILRYRGVDVRILLPSRSDVFAARRASRAYYPELLSAGVRIFEHRGMVHAKTAVVDRTLSCIGSANLDQRSFRLNFEVTTIVDDPRFNEALAELWSRCASDSSEISASDFEKLPWTTRVVDAAFHLASPVL